MVSTLLSPDLPFLHCVWSLVCWCCQS
jgi:hypothetical protein